jgi:transporter family-2 protein
VLITALLAVAGQLTSALLLDLLLPTGGTTVSTGLVVGVALAFIAVLIGARRWAGSR